VRSIRRFGFIVPILVDARNTVVAGHGRLEAAKSLGLKKIPVVKIEHLNETQLHAFMVADNRLVDLSSFDNQLLGGLLKDLSIRIDLEDIGYSAAESDLLIEGVANGDAETKADAIPAVTNAAPMTRRGDQWKCGGHTIRCGNAVRGSDYAHLMGGSKASVVFTDPPYNVNIDGHATTGQGRVRHREFSMASGEMTVEQFLSFLKRICALLAQHSAVGSLHYICMDWRHAGDLISAGTDVYSQLKNVCVWVKSTPGMGSLYRSRHEFIVVFKNGNAKHRNNIELGRFGRNRTNVWEYPNGRDFGGANGEDDLARSHPTPKPVRMIADALLDCSARGEIVLDPFLGSGSTLIAAERVGRICHGIELDPLYVDLAIRRWQQYTGEQAVHAESGTLFDDLASRRPS
jgi:DNA modification methylase